MKRLLLFGGLAILLVMLAACGSSGGDGGGGGNPPEVLDPLELVTTSLAEAQVDAAYSILMVSKGGRATHTWKIKTTSPDQLPAPLILNPTSGEFAGRPQAGTDGTYQLLVEVFDGIERKERLLSLVINPRLSVATTILPHASVGTAYSRQLLSHGGFANQNWSLAAGSPSQLPTGLNLSNTGLLSGTPTTTGTTSVRVQVSDAVITATRDLNIVVEAAPLMVSVTTLPLAMELVPYTAPALQASGGSGNYAWSVSANSLATLPLNLAIAANGVISGTPQAGSENFYQIIFAVNDGAASAEAAFVLQVGDPALTIVSRILPEGKAGTAYSTSLIGGGGNSANYQWTALDPLPDGLSLSTAGLLSGTPSGAGVWFFSLQLEDGSGSSLSKALSLRIREADLLDAKGSFSSAEINHFLTRAQFGVTQEALAAIGSAGSVAAYLDQMLIKETTPALETQALAMSISQPAFPNRVELARWYEQLLVTSDAPLQEAMGFFWHDHFATSSTVLGETNGYYMIDHINTLRHGALGNFRQLLFEVAIDKAMLVGLNGIDSRVGTPNENFAREFWELFTVGVDQGYTQANIVEAARVFTGFMQSFNGTQSIIQFREQRHDSGDKTLFGRTISGRSGPDAYLEYYDLIDVTLDELAVAEFIVTKLWEWFAYPNPEPEVVAGLAKTFRDNNWELRPVLRQMFLSNAYYSPAGMAARAKSPLEFAAGLIRATGLEVPLNVLDDFLRQSGQQPTNPPDVAGWPSGPQWLGADALIQRANFAANVRNERSYQAGRGHGIEDIIPLLCSRSAPETVDHMAKLLNLELSVSERNLYIDYLNTEVIGSVEIGDPFDGGDSVDLEERARGLLYMLAQHPSYQFR